MSATASPHKTIIGAALLLALLVGFFVWKKFHYAGSVAEAIFLSNLLSKASDSGVQEIRLRELTSFDWELVCDSHGYDEPLHLKQYGRTYPTVGAMQDGAWGLIFVRPGGDYESASGSCSDGFHPEFKGARCLSPDAAVFVRAVGPVSPTCARFAAN